MKTFKLKVTDTVHHPSVVAAAKCSGGSGGSGKCGSSNGGCNCGSGKCGGGGPK